jgi:hypothetical protein
MALVSPGVQVNVIDESFYTPAEPGTVPLIFIATKQNKANPAGTGIAPGTLAANAEKLYLISSQRELSETFGDALFYTDANNNPIHGSEQNEYGLQAAYSFLGVSNRAYVIRADIDLDKIAPSAVPPGGTPTQGSHWFDVGQTRFGVFEWDGRPSAQGGQIFTNKVPTVITDTTKLVNYDSVTGSNEGPKASVGAIGDYAIVAVTKVTKLFYKNNSNVWVLVGSTAWAASIPVLVGTKTIGSSISFSDSATGALFINGKEFAVTEDPLQDLVDDINSDVDLQDDSITAGIINNRLALFSSNGETVSIGVNTDANVLEALGLTVGDYNAPALAIQTHTQVPQWKLTGTSQTPRPTGSIWIKTTTPNAGADWSIKRYNSVLAAWERIPSPIYPNGHTAIARLDPTGGGINLKEGDLYIKSNIGETDNTARFRIYRRSANGETVIRSVPITDQGGNNDFAITISASQTGSDQLTSNVSLNGGLINLSNTPDAADELATAINAANLANVEAEVDNLNRVVIRHKTGGEIRFTEDPSVGTILTTLFGTQLTQPGFGPNEYVASLWSPLEVVPSLVEPKSTPDNGELWFNSIIDEIDIMVHDGTTWVGYRNEFSTTSNRAPFVGASEPTTVPEDEDIWVSTADLENFPTIYRWRSGRWNLVDKTDQTSENGILFADARYNTSGANSDQAGSIEALLNSDYLDPDAPDPALYPRGMLLWNLRRSGFNVKRFVKGYIDQNQLNIRFGNESMGSYFADRWVTESRNNDDGSGSFGSNAQRKVVVQRLQAMVNSNQDIRDDESRLFNLMACPGYPELINEMISLNFDRGLTAFIIGDSPMKLQPNTTSINNWANNINLALEDSIDGLVSRDEYLGVYYPAGFTSDNAGNNIVVPPSHMVLRTIALNDQVAYPWFAPAGTRRGGVTNATATGFINSEGEFVSVALNEGQRDTLYQANVNPITFITGSGLVIFGQKTRARNASALDRINVARLVIFLRRQLSTLAKPYLFEPNDKITRDEIKAQVESLLVELVGLRALYDYIVVCDESNNTPARIDRNELYVDIAIEPVKAVEFIYIPLRLKNTGEIAGL